MSDFFKKRLEATEAQIEQIETAITAITVGGLQSYSINTGQSTQSVTRASLKSWQDALDQLYSRRDVIRARLYGDGVTNVRAAW